ncbi:MAG: SDR family NAD(P)-dependent oxidoreductase [Janthinobacterium lividum]
MTTSISLSGRNILVTGASSGIGRGFALSLARAGANLVIGARRTALLEELKAEIEALGVQALAVAMDVADEASVIAAFDAAEAHFGEVHSVVANAGITVPGRAVDLPVESFDQVMDVNLKGTFLTVREAARRMMAKDSASRAHGRIVIISSITAHHVTAHFGPYSATKAAVNQLGRVLARDWAAKGINVNMIEPGYMHTDLTEGLEDTSTGKALLARFARPRFMDTATLDLPLLWLCSDASAQVTGSVFTLDDGQSL